MKTLLRLLPLLALASCAPHIEKQAPAVTKAMVASSGSPEADLQSGRALYIAHCGRCHELQMPDSVSSADWHVVVPGMAWNAGISKADEAAIHRYLLAAKARP
jgi:cytochrome c5